MSKPAAPKVSLDELRGAAPSGHPSVLSRIDDAIAAELMRFMATWTYADHLRSRIVTKLIDGVFISVSAMISAVNNAGARRAAISALAKERLSGEDLELFKAVMSEVAEVETVRGDNAHGLWCFSERLPHHLVLANPADAAEFEAHWVDATKRFTNKVRRGAPFPVTREARIRAISRELRRERPACKFKTAETFDLERVKGLTARARYVHDILEKLERVLWTEPAGRTRLRGPLWKMLPAKQQERRVRSLGKSARPPSKSRPSTSRRQPSA